MTIRRITKIILFILLLLPVWGHAQQVSNLSGTLYTVGDEPLPYANIGLQGSSFGAASNENGQFRITGITPGQYQLVISAVGYKKWVQSIQVEAGKNIALGQLQLQEDLLGLEEVVVTGTMTETFVSASPIKVDVITSRYLQKFTSPNNIIESVALVNGVQEVVSCGVCFTNSISINGLDGPNTAILMDGSPIYGNLAGVYGLNGIPTMIIDRFEVVKGPSSTLYGSEAIAGVINIITKDPSTQPIFSSDIKVTSHGETFTNLAFAPQIGKFDGYVGLNHAYANLFEDHNNDEFSDVINTDQISLFTKWAMRRKNGKKFTLTGKYYYEDRRNGVEAFLQNRAYRKLRGDEQVYGESIYTKRMEFFGTYELPTKAQLKLDYSFSHHDQDSYYGNDSYQAEQGIAYTNFTWTKTTGQHGLLSGLTFRYQNYDDNTVATLAEGKNKVNTQFIPGLFLQDEWTVNEKFTLLSGARLDIYKNHGPIFSPRLNLKYKAGQWTTLRGNFGTGFRIVNLFTEDHAFVTGQRNVEISEELKPEQSYNGSLNINHVYTLGNSQGMIDLDAYYTYFTNKIIPNYEQQGKIIYENTKGNAVTRGIGINVQHQFYFPLAFNLGYNVQRAINNIPDENGVNQTADIEFAAHWSGIGTINYDWKRIGVSLAYTVEVTGPMALPEVFDLMSDGAPSATPRPTTSETFAVHNIQITKNLSKGGLQAYVGMENLFDFRQKISPLTGYNDPATPAGFSEFFDTAYAYAPIHGREVYLGLRWQIKRKSRP